MISIYFECAGSRKHLGDYDTDKEARRAALEAIEKEFHFTPKYFRGWLSERNPNEEYCDFGSWSTYVVYARK